MSFQGQAADLRAAMARLEAQRRGLGEARSKLRGRAAEQLETMGPALDACAGHVAAGKGGGVMGHRRHLALLSERERLEAVVGTPEAGATTGA